MHLTILDKSIAKTLFIFQNNTVVYRHKRAACQQLFASIKKKRLHVDLIVTLKK